MNTLLDMKRNLLVCKSEILAIKTELIFRRLLRAATKAGYNKEQARDDLGRWTNVSGIGVQTSPGFQTGIPTIDDTSQALSDTLVRVMAALEYLPTMSPQIYGTAVHVAFGISVNLQGLPGVGDVERTFNFDDADPRYGLLGSVRTDVTLRNIQGDIIAIYDVKTGERPMSKARANELREKTAQRPGRRSSN